MATILLKKRDTTGAPSAGDLTNSASGAEVAVNTYDKRLHTKDSGGNVVELGTNPTSVTTGALTATGTTTLATSLTGVLKAASGVVSSATAGTDYVTPGSANTFTAAQTFRAANAVRSEAASTQDAVVIAGRAGGTSSYAVTLTPATLNASRTVTLADGGEIGRAHV